MKAFTANPAGINSRQFMCKFLLCLAPLTLGQAAAPGCPQPRFDASVVKRMSGLVIRSMVPRSCDLSVMFWFLPSVDGHSEAVLKTLLLHK